MLVKIILLGVFCLHASVVRADYNSGFRIPRSVPTETTWNNAETTTSRNNATTNFTSNNKNTSASTSGSVNQTVTSTANSTWINAETTTSRNNATTNFTSNNKNTSASTPGSVNHKINTKKAITTTTTKLRTCEYFEDGETIKITNNGLERLQKGSFGSSMVKCLNLQNNKIDEIEDGVFDDFPNLRYVNLSGNRLSFNYPFGKRSMNISNIETLILDNTFSLCYNCKSEKFFMGTRFPHLKNLLMRRNHIAQIFFRSLLKSFDGFSYFNGYSVYHYIDDNGNSFLDYTLTELMPSLSYLDLSDNDIESVNFLNSIPDTLRHLILNNNKIYRFQGISLKSLEELSLNNNRLKALCSSREHILAYRDYDCHGEHGLKVEDAKKLKTLSLSNTHLEIIREKSLANLTNLVELNLSQNSLSSLEKNIFDDLEKLEILDLQSNSLYKLPNFCNLKSLVKLNLSSNHLQSIGHEFNCSIPKLEILSLSKNSIEFIVPGEFDSLLSLRKLDLSFNSIQVLPTNWIASTNNLHVLNLNKNKFSSIANMSLENCYNVKQLSLVGNLIKEFTVESIKNLPNHTVIMTDNSA